MSLIVGGDAHGDVLSKLSYRDHPKLRNFFEKDIFIILGDCGICWPGFEKETTYLFNTLDETKPFEIWFLAGNHDNYDYMESLPIVEHCGGKMRQIVWDGITYPKMFAIPDPTIINIEGKKILLIPHAESHDAQYLVYPDDKETIKQYKKEHKWFRIVHESWWPQEKLDIQELEDVIGDNTEFDFILSHDAPGMINEHFKRPGSIARVKSTEGQEYLEYLRQTLTFKHWYHGHFHFDMDWPERWGDSRITGVYNYILQII